MTDTKQAIKAALVSVGQRADELIAILDRAGLTLALNATHPQVKLQVWYLVECADPRCGGWDEYQPGGDSQEKALASATGDFDMGPREDGKLYCDTCSERLSAEAACAANGHAWSHRRRGLEASEPTEYRVCRRCFEREEGPVNA